MRRELTASSYRIGLYLVIFGFFGLQASTAFAQECSDEQSDKAMNYSLYYEDYKNQNFESALPYLKWILTCAPGFPSNSDRNFERAVEVYAGIGESNEDPVMRRTYLDSALYVYDTAVTRMEDAGIEYDPYDWVFQKGRFIQQRPEELGDLQSDVGSIYQQAFDMDAARIQPYYVNYIIADYVQRDDKGGAVDFMDHVEETIPDNGEVMTMLTDWRGRLFTSPEERIGFLEDQLAKKPEDNDIRSELFELLMDEGYRDRVYELAPAMMASDPSARTYRLVAKMRLEDGQAEEAIDLYQQSLEMDGGPEAAKEVYYNIGIAHQQEGRLSSARTSFRRSLQADANYGAAYMAIGDLYVTAVQGCGSFEREDRAVYWLAADYYDRAASRDERIAPQARNRVSGIRRFFPTAEDKFFKGWNAGDSFTINYGCYTWIGENTRVR